MHIWKSSTLSERDPKAVSRYFCPGFKIHHDDAPLPSYARRVSQRPTLNEAVRKIIEEELARKPIADADLKESALPIFYIAGKAAYYEGEWKARKPHGCGRVYFDTGHFFQGCFKMAEASCKDGLFALSDGSYYRGAVEESLFEGQGRFVSSSGVTYEGGWRGSRPHGQGREVFADGNEYSGEFVEGVKEGVGMFKWRDGRVYSGDFKGGKIHGVGRFFKGESGFVGTFEENKKKGRGMVRTPYGVYEGQFEEGEFGGAGKFTWNDSRTYTGEFKRGAMDGEGVLTFPTGKSFRSTWSAGENTSLAALGDGEE